MAKTKSTSKRIHTGANIQDATKRPAMPSAGEGTKTKQIRSKQKLKSEVMVLPPSVSSNPDYPLDEEWRRAFEACYNENFSDPRLLIEILNRYLPEEVHQHIEEFLFRYVAPGKHRPSLPLYRANKLNFRKLSAVSFYKSLRNQKIPSEVAITEAANVFRVSEETVRKVVAGKDSAFNRWKNAQNFLLTSRKARKHPP